MAATVKPPIFILCPPRSYSTVCLALLAGHPDLFGFPETSLFLSTTVGDLIEKCGKERTFQRIDVAARTPEMYRYSSLIGLARAVAQLHEGSLREEAVLGALDWLFRHRENSTVDLMSHLLDLVSPQIGIEKSPGTCYTDDTLDRCISAFPEARYLHLTRHPVSCVRSMQAAFSVETMDPLSRLSPPAKIVNWYSCHLRIVQALEKLPRARWMRIRAEDVVGTPDAWLPRILAWLQLESSDQIIREMMHTERWLFASDSDQHLLLRGGDWKFFADPALRPVEPPGEGLVDAQWKITDEGFRRVTALARFLGY
jgi:hypothetical protein